MGFNARQINGDVAFYNNIEDSLTAKWTAQRDIAPAVTKNKSAPPSQLLIPTGDGKLEIIKEIFQGGLGIIFAKSTTFPTGWNKTKYTQIY
ncbi:MAG: hypothetical protein IPH74_16145 [Bacteroidetes bacterium]|nr:hypothetical protein [Bacteroidota bacterium]